MTKILSSFSSKQIANINYNKDTPNISRSYRRSRIVLMSNMASHETVQIFLQVWFGLFSCLLEHSLFRTILLIGAVETEKNHQKAAYPFFNNAGTLSFCVQLRLTDSNPISKQKMRYASCIFSKTNVQIIFGLTCFKETGQ
jgi:hypothetical protein